MNYLRPLSAFMAIVFAAAACGDSPPPGTSRDVSRVTAPPAAQKKAPPVSVTPAEFHARNKMDWVGVAHNKAMDDLRGEIRRSRPKDLCKVIERILVDEPLDPRALKGIAPGQQRELRKRAFDEVGCTRLHPSARRASSSAVAQAPVRFMNASFRQSEELDLSAEGWDLVNQAMTAPWSASSTAELASALAGVTAQASSLNADEASVVEAMASVVLSSYEYWTAYAEAANAEFGAAYGDCIGGGGDAGCYTQASAILFREPLNVVRLASYTRSAAAPCPYDASFIWGGDVWGAGVGLSLGLKYAKSWQVAVGAMFVTAAAGSAAAFVVENFYWWKCTMAKS